MFQELVKLPKIIRQKKDPLIAESTLKRGAKKGPAVPNTKTHYKSMAVNTGTNRPMGQNRELKDRPMNVVKGVPRINGGKIL